MLDAMLLVMWMLTFAVCAASLRANRYIRDRLRDLQAQLGVQALELRGDVRGELRETFEHLHRTRRRTATILVLANGYLSAYTQRFEHAGQKVHVALMPQRDVDAGAMIVVAGEADLRSVCQGNEALSLFLEGNSLVARTVKPLRLGAQFTCELEAWS